MTEWFVDWFSTDEYLYVYRHRNEEDADKLVKLILDNVKLKKFSEILDIACGAGRHSILFAQKGLKVTAIDLSKKLIHLAKQSSNELKLKINFIICDLRALPIVKQFDLVVNLFTSFGYFDDDDENYNIVRTAFKHTKKNGYFILDYFNSAFVRNNLIPVTVENLPGGMITQHRSIEGNRVIKKISVENKNGKKQYLESVRLYDKVEIEKIISETGFKILYEFGNFRGNAFDLKDSERIIIIAKK